MTGDREAGAASRPPPGPRVQVDPPGFEPPGCEVAVIGCGNLLRGDDGVGPILVRRLAETGVPAGVRLVDGGTAGMDTAFAMRGARRVVVVDASRTGAKPGSVFEVPGAQLENLPLDALHPHAFRWDQALAFGRWLLGDGYPGDVVVYLIEAGGVEPGADLSPAVRRAMEQVREMIIAGLTPGTGGTDG
ncbi:MULTISPECIES: hydrogenase maturation protease [unclassified Frankia]